MPARSDRRSARLEREHGWFRGRRRVYVELLRAALGDVVLTRALDVGAGGAGCVRALAQLAERVVRVDLRARGASPAETPRTTDAAIPADAQRLPFRGRSFDLVTLFDVLERVDDERAVLLEVRRALRPGGVIALHVPAYGWLRRDGTRREGGVRRYTRSTLRRTLERAGFRVDRITHTNVVLFPFAPTVLLLELCERLRLVPARHVQRFRGAVPMPRWLSSLLGRLFAAELVVSSRFDVPIGHSILAIARRPTAERRRRRVRAAAQAAARALRPYVGSTPEPSAPLPARPDVAQPENASLESERAPAPERE